MIKFRYYLLWASIVLMPLLSNAQYNSITEAQGQPAGVYTFNFGNGDFQAYIDADGWMLYARYHH